MSFVHRLGERKQGVEGGMKGDGEKGGGDETMEGRL